MSGKGMKRIFINLALAGSFLLGFSGLIAYIPGLEVLGQIRPGYIPMAPTTAFSFIFLSVALWVHGKVIPSSRLNIPINTVTIATTLFGLLELMGFFTGTDLNFEDKIIPSLGTLDGVPIARMSPSTGTLFFFSGIALLSLFKQSSINNSKNRYFGNAAGIFSCLILITALTFLLGYLYGNPLLYDQRTIPMALTTAAGFGFLGVGITAALGTDFFPISHFSGSSTRARLNRVFIPLIIIIILVQSFLFQFSSSPWKYQ